MSTEAKVTAKDIARGLYSGLQLAGAKFRKLYMKVTGENSSHELKTASQFIAVEQREATNPDGGKPRTGLKILTRENPDNGDKKKYKLHPRKASKIKEWIMLNFGVLVVALGIHIFKFPNHFAMGGVAGMSIVMAKIFPWTTPATVSMVINLLLLVTGLIVFGKGFAFRTTYATIELSLLQVALEKIFPIAKPLTQETLLELLFAIALSAFGSAILFNQNASTGGTDIIAMIVKKHSSLDIGKALLFTDLFIGASTFLIFDVRTGLFSIAGIMLKGFVVDSLISSFNRVKYFTIVCSEYEKIASYINTELKRGATILHGEGSFSKNNRSIILCVVSTYQAMALRNYIKQVDAKAFIMITNTSEIVGRGFHIA